MFYFNVSGVELGEVNDYALYTNDVIKGLYNELVNNKYFVTQVGDVQNIGIKKLKILLRYLPIHRL